MTRQASLTILADNLDMLLGCPDEELHAIAKQLPRGLHVDAEDVLSNVDHFLADADIRDRDDDYREMQEGEMRGLIAALRGGAPRDVLLHFSFLK